MIIKARLKPATKIMRYKTIKKKRGEKKKRIRENDFRRTNNTFLWPFLDEGTFISEQNLEYRFEMILDSSGRNSIES